jgi:hypothetical protein
VKALRKKKHIQVEENGVALPYGVGLTKLISIFDTRNCGSNYLISVWISQKYT